MHTYVNVMTTTYTSDMTTMPAVTSQDIQRKSEKSIMFNVPNMYLVDYKEKTTIIEHHQKATSVTTLTALTFVLQTREEAAAIEKKFNNLQSVAEK